MKRGSLLLAALVCFSLVSGCGDDDDGGGDQGGGETAGEEAPASGGCEDVPRALVEAIATGLVVEGGTLRQAQAVKSGDFDDVYFVSAEIDAAGIEGTGDIGTWAKSGPLRVGGGLIYSVDGVAKEVSDWGDGGKTDAQLSMEDDGAEASQECVQSG